MIPDGKSLRPVFYPSYKFIKYPRPDFQLCQRLLDKDLEAEIEPTLPKDIPHVFISSFTQEGLKELIDLLWKALHA